MDVSEIVEKIEKIIQDGKQREIGYPFDAEEAAFMNGQEAGKESIVWELEYLVTEIRKG